MKEKPSTLRPPCSDSLFFSPPPRSRKLNPPEHDCYTTPFEERELKEVCSFVENDDLVEIVKIMDSSESTACPRRSCVCAGSRFSSETPAKLGCGDGFGGSLSVKSPTTGGKGVSPSCPIDIAYERLSSSEGKSRCRLRKRHSFSSDIDREEAWERKRELYAPGGGEGRGRTVGRSVSDCGERNWPARKPTLKNRTRSLTDEDLEELRGCIDLGFGFSSGEDCDLQSTLPALELYYAINRQYKSRSSPVSPLDGRTSSGESPCSPLSDSWRISSPGDHPSQVKTRLRHWAQAVACSIKQGCSL